MSDESKAIGVLKRKYSDTELANYNDLTNRALLRYCHKLIKGLETIEKLCDSDPGNVALIRSTARAALEYIENI